MLPSAEARTNKLVFTADYRGLNETFKSALQGAGDRESLMLFLDRFDWLEDFDRELLAMRFSEDMTLRAIADELNISIEPVHRRLQSLLKRIKKELK